MPNSNIRTMRDALIEQIYKKMHSDKNIFFVSADMGAPLLDKLRIDFKDRFVNVGIAEQNLINVSAGLALEGFTVYAYAIAPFLTMRAYEQIRINLALNSQHRHVNVNLIGVGAGVSYDISGPTHHCLEDISIIRTLPNIALFSPSDWHMAQSFLDFTLDCPSPKYIRLEGKPIPNIYGSDTIFDWEKGFHKLVQGDDICIVSTGYPTHMALEISRQLKNEFAIGLIDIFCLKPLNEDALFDTIKKYKCVVTLEEAFIKKGGLDSILSHLLSGRDSDIRLRSFGFEDKYLFKFGCRNLLYSRNNCDKDCIIRTIREMNKSMVTA